MRKLEFYQPIRFSEFDRKPGENFDNHVAEMLKPAIYQIACMASGFIGASPDMIESIKKDVDTIYKNDAFDGFKTTNEAKQRFKVLVSVSEETLMQAKACIGIHDTFGKLFSIVDSQFIKKNSAMTPSLEFNNEPEPQEVKIPPTPSPVAMEAKVNKPEVKEIIPFNLSQIGLSSSSQDPITLEGEDLKTFNELCEDIATCGVMLTQDISELSDLIHIPVKQIECFYSSSCSWMTGDAEWVIERAKLTLERINSRLEEKRRGMIQVKVTSSEFKPEAKPEPVVEKQSPEAIRKHSLCDRFTRTHNLLNIEDNHTLACKLKVPFSVVRAALNSDIENVSENDLLKANEAISTYYNAVSSDTSAISAAEKKLRLMNEVKNLLPLIGKGLNQREYASILGCRADQVSMICTGRVSHMNGSTLENVHARALEIVKQKNEQMAKQALVEAKKVEKERKDELAKVEENVDPEEIKQKQVNELRAMFVKSGKNNDELAKILGVTREVIISVYGNELSKLEQTFVSTMIEYFKVTIEAEKKAVPTETVVKDFKDLTSLKDLEPKKSETKGLHETGVIIPQFHKGYIEMAKETVRKNYTNTKSAALDIHRRYFNSNKRAFGVISSNPNMITKLCGIDFQITKNIWLPAAKPTPETMLALHLYLEDIQSTIKEIEEKTTLAD